MTLGDVLRAVRDDGWETPGEVARALGISPEAAERALNELRAARLVRRSGRAPRTPFGAMAAVLRAAAGTPSDRYRPAHSVRAEHAELLARSVD